MAFPKNFDWGIASSAYQTEGAYNEDGKGPSIWDVFSNQPNRINGGGNGNVCCDHYHRFREDVALLKELGVDSYRLSVSWSRVFPEGAGKVNPEGLQFYSDLIDEILAAGISPIVNLHHYDIPQALYEKGGWENRETVDHFVHYATTLFDLFEGRVSRYMTLNDVRGTMLGGYVTGERAPGRRGELKAAVQGWHNITMASAKVIEAFRRRQVPGGEIGCVMGVMPIYPDVDTDECRKLAEAINFFYNDAFLSPVIAGKYPDGLLEILEARGLMPEMAADDLEVLARNPADYVGVSYYTCMRVAPREGGNPENPMSLFERRGRVPQTKSGWEIYPDGLYDTLMHIKDTYGNPKVYVSENGAAMPDEIWKNGMIEDDDRIAYLRDHIAVTERALMDGANILGFHVWSLMDNFEWQQGFTKGFGLIHIDRETLKRSPKKSFYWYRDVVANRGL